MPLGGVAQSDEGHRYGRAEPILTTGGKAEPTKRSATFRAKPFFICARLCLKKVVVTALSALPACSVFSFAASCVFGFAACCEDGLRPSVTSQL